MRDAKLCKLTYSLRNLKFYLRFKSTILDKPCKTLR